MNAKTTDPDGRGNAPHDTLTVGEMLVVADWHLEGWDEKQLYEEFARDFAEHWIANPGAFGEFVREQAANMEQEPEEFLSEILSSHGELKHNARTRHEYEMLPPDLERVTRRAVLTGNEPVVPGQALIVTSVERGNEGTEIGFVTTAALWNAVVDGREGSGPAR